MLLAIPDVLNAEQLGKVRQLLDGARFIDGRLSAGSSARKVKKITSCPLTRNCRAS